MIYEYAVLTDARKSLLGLDMHTKYPQFFNETGGLKVRTFEDIFRDRQLKVLDIDMFMQQCLNLLKDPKIRNQRWLDFIHGKPD